MNSNLHNLALVSSPALCGGVPPGGQHPAREAGPRLLAAAAGAEAENGAEVGVDVLGLHGLQLGAGGAGLLLAATRHPEPGLDGEGARHLGLAQHQEPERLSLSFTLALRKRCKSIYIIEF